MLSARDKKSNIDYSFCVNGNDQITLAQMYMLNKDYSLDWVYDEFVLTGNLFFPHKMQVLATTEKRKIDTSMSLSSISLNEPLSLDSSIPSSYAKVDLNEVIKLLSDK